MEGDLSEKVKFWVFKEFKIKLEDRNFVKFM